MNSDSGNSGDVPSGDVPSGDRASEDGHAAAGDERIDRLAADVDHVVRRASRTVELGRRGFAIAVTVFVLLVAELLPWVGDASGWEVLLGDAGAVPRLFASTSIGIGVLASVLALATRRWWLAWVCAVGGWFAAVDGVLAIWSQQSPSLGTADASGPGLGLVLAVLAMITLAGQWLRVAWSRT